VDSREVADRAFSPTSFSLGNGAVIEPASMLARATPGRLVRSNHQELLGGDRHLEELRALLFLWNWFA